MRSAHSLGTGRLSLPNAATELGRASIASTEATAADRERVCSWPGRPQGLDVALRCRPDGVL